jgi:hypothetical protein
MTFDEGMTWKEEKKKSSNCILQGVHIDSCSASNILDGGA